MKIPSVVSLKTFVKPSTYPAFTRFNVFLRDKFCCQFCGSPSLVPYEEIKAPIRPQSLLPFRVADTAVREQIRRWYKSKWLAPNALRSRALVDTVKGVYIPYWTFDAQAVCPWDAEAGHYYYTTETYRGQRVQKFVYKGLAAVTTQNQGVVWPKK